MISQGIQFLTWGEGGVVDLRGVHAKKYSFKWGVTKRILSSFVVMASVGSGGALLKVNI